MNWWTTRQLAYRDILSFSGGAWPGMIGRSVGPKPARPAKKSLFGDQAPAFAPENVPQLGDSPVAPKHGPAFSSGQEHFQTDACLAELQHRQLKQQRQQVGNCWPRASGLHSVGLYVRAPGVHSVMLLVCTQRGCM